MRHLILASLLAITTLPARALPFVDDDYGRALSRARAQHRPIFVEALAPW